MDIVLLVHCIVTMPYVLKTTQWRIVKEKEKIRNVWLCSVVFREEENRHNNLSQESCLPLTIQDQ